MTNAEARFNNSLRPRKPEGSVGRTAQDGHLDFHTAPELWSLAEREGIYIYIHCYWQLEGSTLDGGTLGAEGGTDRKGNKCVGPRRTLHGC